MANKSIVEVLQEEVLISEAYLTSILWNEPELFDLYTEEELNRKSFINPHWGFYFGLGRYMFKQNLLVFDDITVAKAVKELGLESKYEDYGGYETINEVMEEVKGKDDNIDGYHEEVQKYSLIRRLCGLFGEQVVESTDKYDYHRMNRDQLSAFWEDRVAQITADAKNKANQANLLDDLYEAIEEMDENPDIGLEFFESPLFTEISSGFADGCLYIYGGFGGKGKTSFSTAKVIFSHIKNQKKLLLIANEQSKRDFQKMILVTAIGYLGIKFDRRRMNQGGFTEDEKDTLKKAADWVYHLINEDDSLIKFIYLDSYTMENVKQEVRFWYRRGYRSLMIDTGKPGDDANGMVRWQKFTEDFTQLYKLIKPDGGLNIPCWVNVQLADSAYGARFLTYNALGDAKKIKNEASVVFLGRPLYDDEYQGEKQEIKYKAHLTEKQWDEHPDALGEYTDGEITLPLPRFTTIKIGDDKEKKIFNQYYLVFTGKNRRGQDNDTGLEVLVMRVDFNLNKWEELGFAQIAKDYSH